MTEYLAVDAGTIAYEVEGAARWSFSRMAWVTTAPPTAP